MVRFCLLLAEILIIYNIGLIKFSQQYRSNVPPFCRITHHSTHRIQCESSDSLTQKCVTTWTNWLISESDDSLIFLCAYTLLSNFISITTFTCKQLVKKNHYFFRPYIINIKSNTTLVTKPKDVQYQDSTMWLIVVLSTFHHNSINICYNNVLNLHWFKCSIM